MSYFDGLGSALGDAVKEAEANTYSDPAQGTYEFEVLGMEMKVGTKANPDARNFIIHYSLEGDDGNSLTYNEWLRIPDIDDPRNISERDKVAMSIMKQRFLSLGIDESELNTFGPEDVEGLTGTLRIVYTKPKKPNESAREYFVNVRDVKVKQTASTAAEPATVAARPASRKAAPKAAPSEDAAPQKPQVASAVGNPFAR